MICYIYISLLFSQFTESPMDYIATITILSFAACQERECVHIDIIDDSVQEEIETFRITLQRTTGLDSRITFSLDVGVIEIEESDGK